MPISAKGDGFGQWTKDAIAAIDRAVLDGMAEATEGVKQDVRAQVRAAGLGNRVANAWRSRVYENAGGRGDGPTGFVWSRAPNIIAAYDQGTTIAPRGGHRYLWLPSKAVPMVLSAGRDVRRRRATPAEVEVRFGRFVIRKGKGKSLLAFVERKRGTTKGGKVRKVRQGRIGSGAASELVLMFTLLPTQRTAKKLDVAAVASRWGDKVPGIIDRRLREG